MTPQDVQIFQMAGAFLAIPFVLALAEAGDEWLNRRHGDEDE